MDSNSAPLQHIPKVSIGMPVYNGEIFIRQALDSLLAQTFGDFELIISDNASTDETMTICYEYAARDKRIRYIRQLENTGPIANFNSVLGQARSEYFMWAACDDLWEPHYLTCVINHLQPQAEAVLAFSAFDNINAHAQPVQSYPHLFALPAANVFERLYNYMAQPEVLGKANLIYSLTRRSALQAVGGFQGFEKNTWGADMLVVFRLLTRGRLALTEEVLFHKRLPPPPARSALRSSLTLLTQRLAMVPTAWAGWHTYFSGYQHTVDQLESLTPHEKSQLTALLRRRAAEAYWNELRVDLIRPALRWMSGQRRAHGASQTE